MWTVACTRRAPDVLVSSRFLEGPNLYFPRPAVKVTLDISTLLGIGEDEARALGHALGLKANRPGEAGSGFRAIFATRLVTHCVRRVAQLGGSPHIAVRTRVGEEPHELVVAIPWRHEGRVEAFCAGLGSVVVAMGDGPVAMSEAITAAGAALRSAPLGREPSVFKPTVPVVGVTGTNGKTTTSRMIGHIAQTAGRVVGWSSTEGVFANGQLVEAGDYSGPGGARMVLKQPGIQLGVLETARGGILRRGLGVSRYDVTVVTNVSADHLGVDGIHTLDQLAEAKSVLVQATRRRGWAVLNADDPRVWPMRHLTPARPWAFSRDAGSPHVREALDEGGRATVVVDGWITVLNAGSDPLPVTSVLDVPMALSGLSRANTENALAAASAALALGFAPSEVAAGLAAFRPDLHSDGRMNIFTVPADGGDHSVVIDMAHNEASFEAMLETVTALRPEGRRVLLGIGCSGDRSDDSIVRMGEIAGLGAEGSVIKPPEHYLRGRSFDSMVDCFREGLARAGQEPLAVVHGEVQCLEALFAEAQPGDVVAMMTHEDRAQAKQWLAARGATPDTPELLRAKVSRLPARGSLSGAALPPSP